MKIKKKFDCVQMKWDIQRQIAEDFAGMPEEEARRIMRERVAADPILGRFFEKVRAGQ